MKDRADLLPRSRQTVTSAGARRRRAAVQRLLPLFVLAVGLLGAPLLLVSAGGLGRLDRLERERRQVELEISRLTKRIEQARAGAEAAKRSPMAVERAARDQLGLLRRTDVVFQFTTGNSS